MVQNYQKYISSIRIESENIILIFVPEEYSSTRRDMKNIEQKLDKFLDRRTARFSI